MIQLTTYDPDLGRTVATEVALSPEWPEKTVRLRCLDGASAIFLEARDTAGPRTRVEIAADGGEIVPVQFRCDNTGGVQITSPGRHVLNLALEGHYSATEPLRVPLDAPLDLAMVIDGTLRSPDGAGQLLADGELWAAHIERCLAVLTALTESFPESRIALLAFGDESPPQARAEDLRPRYRFFPKPGKTRFGALDLTALRSALTSIPATSGGDVVDALADALAACTGLRWRSEARKLVLVSGDSPGFSLLHPPPVGADVCIRSEDVDEQALRLHQRGIELMTVFHRPSEIAVGSLAERLIDYTAVQYRRLASRPELAWSQSDFDPQTVLAAIRDGIEPVGRESTWGQWVGQADGSEQDAEKGV